MTTIERIPSDLLLSLMACLELQLYFVIEDVTCQTVYLVQKLD